MAGAERMAAGVEVGERRGARTTTAAIVEESSGRQETRLPRQVLALDQGLRQGLVQILPGIEARRHFGGDDLVDDDRLPIRDLRQNARGPVRPDAALHHIDRPMGHVSSKQSAHGRLAGRQPTPIKDVQGVDVTIIG